MKPDVVKPVVKTWFHEPPDRRGERLARLLNHPVQTGDLARSKPKAWRLCRKGAPRRRREIARCDSFHYLSRRRTQHRIARVLQQAYGTVSDAQSKTFSGSPAPN